MTVATGSWRDALEAGRFDEAQKLYLLSEEDDNEVRRGLHALKEIHEAVREKAWRRAKRLLEALEDAPPVVDWSQIRGEIERLEEVSQQINHAQTEEALASLQAFPFRWFRAEVANQQGTAHAFAGDYPEAREAFEQATELDPKHYRALTNLGNVYLEEDAFDKAIECYEQALRLNEDFANAHHNLGVAYRRNGQVGKSVRHLRRAQRVRNRTEQERAREELGDGAAKAGLKAIRWVLYGAVAVILFIILRNQGFI